MSDFELLSIILMILAIIISLLLEVIKSQKKVAAPGQRLRLLLKRSS